MPSELRKVKDRMVSLGNEKYMDRLWGEGAIRAFISHTHEQKVEASDIQKYLRLFGIASFVAHEDIEPMKEWETEIEHALFSMDILIALVTEKFGASNWTDQEVGVAFGRKVPIVPIRWGRDPYGFMGKYQAISASIGNRKIAEEIFRFVLGHERLRSSAADMYISALADSGSFNLSNSLAVYLSEIEQLSPEQEANFIEAFNGNKQVYGAWDVSGCIVEHLKRMTGNDYVIDNFRLKLFTDWADSLPF